MGISIDVKAKVIRISPPPVRSPGKIVGGDDPTAKARELVRLLREEAKVI